MKKLLLITIIFLSTSVFAKDYFLEIEKVCSSSGNEIVFKCESKSQREQIFTEHGKWYGRNKSNVMELKIVKNDEYILVLENPVLFSGTDFIHIFKATGKFYWSQIAYSDMFEESEVTIKYGTTTKVDN